MPERKKTFSSTLVTFLHSHLIKLTTENRIEADQRLNKNKMYKYLKNMKGYILLMKLKCRTHSWRGPRPDMNTTVVFSGSPIQPTEHGAGETFSSFTWTFWVETFHTITMQSAPTVTMQSSLCDVQEIALIVLVCSDMIDQSLNSRQGDFDFIWTFSSA